MKVRNGFVSNSSSSSFVISIDDLTPRQLRKIQDHIDVAKTRVFREMLEDRGIEDFYVTDDDRWYIDVTEDKVEGSTSMDNFDMRTFLAVIGVDMSRVKWGDGYL